jgi:hypothetical protein
MEKITKRDGRYYYGEDICRDVDDAYEKFRDDYHELLGKQVWRQLDRTGQRMERTHGIGSFHPWREQPDGREFINYRPARYYVLGIVGISYWYKVGSWDFPGIADEEKFDRWLEWAFTKGSRGLVLKGHRPGSRGRTGKEYIKSRDDKKKHNNKTK